MKTATLKFSRKPYWYLKDSLEEQQVPYSSSISGGVDVNLVNPYPSDACPSIIFEVNTSPYSSDFTFRFTISVSSTYNGVYSTKSYTFRNLKGNYVHRFVEIDIENQRAFTRSADGEFYKFCDSDIPKPLGPGESVIHIDRSTDISNVFIVPKWRCL